MCNSKGKFNNRLLFELVIRHSNELKKHRIFSTVFSPLEAYRCVKFTFYFLFTAMWTTNRMDTDDINSLCWSPSDTKTQIVTRSKVNSNKLNNCRRIQYQEYPSFQDFELTDSSSVIMCNVF